MIEYSPMVGRPTLAYMHRPDKVWARRLANRQAERDVDTEEVYTGIGAHKNYPAVKMVSCVLLTSLVTH